MSRPPNPFLLNACFFLLCFTPYAVCQFFGVPGFGSTSGGGIGTALGTMQTGAMGLGTLGNMWNPFNLFNGAINQSPQVQYPCPPGCGLFFQCSGCSGGFVVVSTTSTVPIIPPLTNVTTTTTPAPTTTTTTRGPPTNTTRTVTTTTSVLYVYPSWCSSWCQLYYRPKPQPSCILYSWLGLGL